MSLFEFTGDGPSSLTLGIIGIACLAVYEAPHAFRRWLSTRRRRRFALALLVRRALPARRIAHG
ncbi:MAG: hypothetical protein JNG90_04515 [Planctomycetaceae bacterium]|nr:hypothetical protein [Planctomycetaceae bacterium]